MYFNRSSVILNGGLGCHQVVFQQFYLVLSFKKHANIYLFINKLNLTNYDWYDSAPLLMTLKAWNRLMHTLNGNKMSKPAKIKDFLDVMYQNLPGTLGVTTLGTQLDSIVSRMKPDVLFVGEADSEDIKAACPEGYVWVGGNLKSKIQEIRVSAIVREKIPFKSFNIKTKVPAVGLKVGEWRLIGIYREWALCGDQTTKSKDQQIDRLTDFVNYWSGIKSKSACLGDFNFDPFPDSDYQRSLENIRTCVNDVILPAGWCQLIKDKTRFESDMKPSLLDHVYVNQVDKTERTWNESFSGYNHNLVGVESRPKERFSNPRREALELGSKACPEGGAKSAIVDLLNELY